MSTFDTDPHRANMRKSRKANATKDETKMLSIIMTKIKLVPQRG